MKIAYREWKLDPNLDLTGDIVNVNIQRLHWMGLKVCVWVICVEILTSKSFTHLYQNSSEATICLESHPYAFSRGGQGFQSQAGLQLFHQGTGEAGEAVVKPV